MIQFKLLCRAIAVVLLLTAGAWPAAAQISKSVGLLKGEITSDNGEHLSGIPVKILKGTENVNSTRSNSDGKFTAILQPNATYRIAIASNEYGYHEDTIVVPALSEYQEYPLHVVLTAMRDGERPALNSPVFLPKSSLIEAAATADLEKVADLMRHNSRISLAVTVYPDALVKSKKDAAQQRLVNARAAAMRSFFLGKSIAPNRINVTTGTTVPPGRFATNITETSSKKKKKQPTKTVLVPQYVEIVTHVAS
ncbi:MAG TPA: hypothetical protein VG537_09280 [Candidatus Kapabacteria bacterium]|jgi:hypothetical protein|nr:hypothetical protein [Candidatus Kapabacteria bacterium]